MISNGLDLCYINQQYFVLMQEEGWVVCRAFRKPSPSHQRPGFEAWNHPYYAREATYPSHPSSNMVNNNPNYNPQGESSTFQHCVAASAQDLALSASQSFSDIQLAHEVLPQLDSPSSVSASFAASESAFQQNCLANGDFDNEIRSNNSTSSGQYIDWKNLDNLLASATFVSTNNVFPSDSASIPQSNYRQQVENSHFLGCFPDL